MSSRLGSYIVTAALAWAGLAGGQGQRLPGGAPQAGPAKRGGVGTIHFRYVAEPRERAFEILVPRGWQVEGGISRVDPTRAGGPANSIAAKCDLTIKRDAQGSVLIRFLPDVLYIDMRGSPAAAMGAVRPGSQYNGMTYYPLMNAPAFLARIVFPYAHPRAQAVQIQENKALPRLAQSYLQRVRAFPIPIQFSYDAGLLAVAYQEGGVPYRERLMTVIENWGAAAAGMWGNKETLLVRAPAADFEKWLPVFSIVQGSVRINPQWLHGELMGQIQRGEIALRTQREIQAIDRQITEHRRLTVSEINNDMFLTLTGQEEYINPHTGRVELGSNEWHYRWVNPAGEQVYTDDSYYDPNRDPSATRSDFKRSPVRPRKP